jgi:hypothetical protein
VVALAVAALMSVALLTGCDALGKLGAADHYPAARSFTVSGRVTTVVIDADGGSVEVDGSSRSTVAVSQQASYTSTAPVARHVLSGTTLTLSYSCPSELSCSISYTVAVPRAVAVRVSAGAGAITLNSLSGAVTAQTSEGVIIADDLRSAAVSFKSDTGGIIATWSAVPSSVHASNDVGGVALTVPGSVAYKISTRTIVGLSTITVRQSATSRYAISASSDLGSISISPG